MVVTPLRDGMSLVAKEYVACREDLGGALVLSEFAGAAEERKDLTRRMRSMRRRIVADDVERWAKDFRYALEEDN